MSDEVKLLPCEERVARAICWAMTEETDDCSSKCLNARKCMADPIDPCFVRDARAAIAAIEATRPTDMEVRDVKE